MKTAVNAMDILKKLFVPLNYLRIEHKLKSMLDYILPMLFSGLICILYYVLPVSIELTGDNGFVSKLNAQLQVLSGFYVAALGAIATFPNKNMDCLMDGHGLQLNGDDLTRRQFLSYLFGYLAFMGFILLLVALFVDIFKPSIEYCAMVNSYDDSLINCELINSLDSIWLNGFFLFVYLTVFLSIFFTTLLGVYYLTYKIHENKPKFVD